MSCGSGQSGWADMLLIFVAPEGMMLRLNTEPENCNQLNHQNNITKKTVQPLTVYYKTCHQKISLQLLVEGC